jgi:hypothetical protein
MAGTTTTTRKYPFSDTPNTKVNPNILEAEVVAAGPYGDGGTITEVSVTLQGTDVYLAFDGLLLDVDETTLDVVIDAHQGQDFSEVAQEARDETESSDDSGSRQSKLALNTGPLPAGTYLVAWYAEIECDAVVAGTGCKGSLTVGGTEVASSVNDLSQYISFSGSAPRTIVAGDGFDLDLGWERSGASSNPAKMRRARLSVTPL